MKLIILLCAVVAITTKGTAQTNIKTMEHIKEPAAIVRAFLMEVRSGKKPENAHNYMAEKVAAHQLNSENPQTVTRTPADYTGHIREFLEVFGNFDFEITELIAQSDKVYVRWKQTGHHLQEIDGFAPTGKELIEYASAVYRIENGMIVEYWIQVDRLGMLQQLKETK